MMTPFSLAVPEADLADLAARLDRIRWPDRQTEAGWAQGVPLDLLQRLCAYWRSDYDWRRCEAKLNALGQHRIRLDGVDIHFLRILSPEPNALPLLMTHGWPGSVIEFLDVIEPLTDPVAHGGRSEDAFHLILPSIPGYGFSGHPAEPGWDTARIARLWAELMRKIGFDHYVAQGGDWGAIITKSMAAQHVPGCRAIHLNLPMVLPGDADMADMTDQERAILADMQAYQQDGIGYATLQATRPQTLGYALADSPVAQAAWIVEKLDGWSDTDDIIGHFGFDAILDNVMLYWLPNAGVSSARLYRESLATAFSRVAIDMPTGISIFPREAFRCSRRWAERDFSNLIHWNELDRGGHFAAWEQPRLFVEEVRNCFRSVR